MARLSTTLFAASLVGLMACGNSDTHSEAGSGGTSSGTGGQGAQGSASATGTGGAMGTTCASEDDCTGATSHCDVASGMCVGCSADADCRGSLKCDTATGICRDCVTDADCAAPRPFCDAVSGQCTDQCMTDADCASTGGPTRCDTARMVCVDCTGNGQLCQYCELMTFSCVGCLQDSDCPMSAPFCASSFECSPQCASDGDCPGSLHCDPATSRCLECVTNGDCPGEVCQTNHTCG